MVTPFEVLESFNTLPFINIIHIYGSLPRHIYTDHVSISTPLQVDNRTIPLPCWQPNHERLLKLIKVSNIRAFWPGVNSFVQVSLVYPMKL